MRNYYVILIPLFLLCGCEKDEQPDAIPKVKTREYFDSGRNGEVTVSYTYDSDGRVATMSYTGAINRVATYVYNGDSVTRRYSDQTGSRIYVLNSEGYAIEEFFRSSSGSDYTPEVHIYDSEGHILSGLSGSYEWEGDNRIREFFSGDTVDYTYLADKVSTIENHNVGIYFLGKGSKNLKNTRTSSASGDTVTYSYEYDSQGRVTVMNGGADTSTYTYY